MGSAEVFATGLRLGESPRWHDGRLWFCDWGARRDRSPSTSAGGREVDGRASHDVPVLASTGCPTAGCSSSRAASARCCGSEPDGSLVDARRPRRASPTGWNEIVVDGRGNAYVNSAGFDLMGGEAPRRARSRWSRPTAPSAQVADGVGFPNGMAVTPDDSTLIVAESYGSRLTAFDIAADGGAVGPAGVGRPRRRRARRDLPRCRGRRLVRRRAEPALRAGPRGRRGARRRSTSTAAASRACSAAPTGARCSSSRPSGPAPAGCWTGAPTGQVLTHRAPAPHAGHP